ncbi:hypothetical protein KP509_17G029200 [Ceratopteris richardii]|uniref:Uncharacterized protein n=1 Tax=Ceratopteris richardii TaxID=49495 RepID=A0A8T2SXY4_CERRI|nr:hypothetical protein KP509_17G029200 [Ceratopteris richardii]
MSSAVVGNLVHPLKKPSYREDQNDTPFPFHPILYVTPSVVLRESTSSAPSSPSASPYVVNFKRRGPNTSIRNQDVGGQEESAPHSSTSNEDTDRTRTQEEDMKGMDVAYPCPNLSCSGTYCRAEENGLSEENAMLADLPDLESVTTKTHKMRMRPAILSRQSSTCEEFYDAPETPSDDSHSLQTSVNAVPLMKMRDMSAQDLEHSLQEEVARRIRAEEALALLQESCNGIIQRCASIGILMAPNEDMTNSIGKNMHDACDHLSERLAVARMVAGAVARAAAKVTKDEEMEHLIASKNWEISRLWDKLQYLEIINREMSQRNQECIEIAKRQRQRSKRNQKLFLGFFCSTIFLGTAGLLCHKSNLWSHRVAG